MAREILFRGKRVDNGKWAQGYLFRIWEKAYICWGTVNNAPDMKEVDPETVCQHTGLTDGNGMKIFENDICKLIADDDDLYRIQWDEDTARYILSQFGSIMDDFECLIADDIEVIGNIFDNSELMKES